MGNVSGPPLTGDSRYLRALGAAASGSALRPFNAFAAISTLVLSGALVLTARGQTISGVDGAADGVIAVEAELVADGSAGGGTAGIDGSCESVGEFVQVFTFANRFRGNAYQFDFPAILKSFALELNFTGLTEVHFSVMERRTVGKPPEERFFRVPELMDDVVISVGGRGRSLYSTNESEIPMPPIHLAADRIYVLAASWGNRLVAYGRDVEQYPGEFSHGEVLGSVSATLGAGPPLDPMNAGVMLQVFDGGAYSMRLCFEPELGACCCPEPNRGVVGCEDVLLTECQTRGGFFLGERTTCASGDCLCGACCDSCGDCADGAAPAECAQEGGTWQGENTTCTPSLCTPLRRTGACCDEVMCVELCDEECAAIGGIYRGDMTDCQPNICIGACCVFGDPDEGQVGGCLDNKRTFCETTLGGTYKGDGTTCATLAPAQECGGGCCWGIGAALDRCQPVSHRSGFEGCVDASFPHAHYLGDGTLCPADCEDPGLGFVFGACCLNDGTCLVTTPEFCNADWILGTYRGDGTTCGTAGCTPADDGACCLSNGQCGVLTETQCQQLGAYQGDGTQCQPNPCPQPTGACCLPSGMCNIRTQAACEAAGGVYRGNGENCSAGTCPQPTGACCATDGSCSVLTQAQCVAASGMFQGPAIPCNPCPQPVGACCMANGSCDEVTEAQCGGVYQGNGTECATANCPPQMGACCASTAPCRLTMEPDCTAPDVFRGLLTTCETACDGACCHSGVCLSNLDAGGCEAFEGDFQGVDTVCIPSPCDPPPTGACCLGGGGCQSMTQAECTSQGAAYLGNGTSCTPNPCVTASGTCCLVSGDCMTATATECSAGQGAFQGVGTSCVTDPCGACCLRLGCASRTEARCTDESGTFQGDGVHCTPDPCMAVEIVSSSPPARAIDARQPSNVDGSNPAGWNSVVLTMSGSASGLMATDFAVTVMPNDTPPPTINTATPNGTMVTLQFSGIIPLGHWTIVTHGASGTSTCLGFLPADVNADRTASPQDILALIDCINGVNRPTNCDWDTDTNLISSDADRSGQRNSQDILRVIDLLNGAGMFDVANGRTLPPAPCSP